MPAKFAQCYHRRAKERYSQRVPLAWTTGLIAFAVSGVETNTKLLLVQASH
jgi:hypothetical protein